MKLWHQGPAQCQALVIASVTSSAAGRLRVTGLFVRALITTSSTCFAATPTDGHGAILAADRIVFKLSKMPSMYPRHIPWMELEALLQLASSSFPSINPRIPCAIPASAQSAIREVDKNTKQQNLVVT